MILKLFAKGKWHYYDNIKSIEKEHVVVSPISDGLIKQPEIKDNTYNLSDTDYILHDWDSTQQTQDVKCRRVIYKRNDGVVGAVVFNHTAYLLNDEGKTIDRI